MRKVALILLNAGASTRFRSTKSPKKQWLRLDEIPLWLKVAKEVSSFYAFSTCIITASNQEEKKLMEKYIFSYELNFEVVIGGETRQDSLENALKNIKEEWVLVSDVARANIPKEIFLSILENKEDFDCIVPFLNIYDTTALEDETSLSYLKRENLKIIQTPQLSKTKVLKLAITKGQFTDESSAILASGGKIGFIEGSKESLKITHLKDLEAFNFPPPSQRAIMGFGSDIHAFQKGEGLLMGGIKIPAPYEFIAHSDGDVCLHSLSDAILGGIGAGDIGEWFPDNDPSFKGADSAKLLEKILDFALDVGYSIRQVDITIFAQTPKLSPYKSHIEKNIAKLLNIPLFCVNLKATTTEHLGFVGRKEGILVQTLVVMEYFNWTKLLKEGLK
ncbi:bifunctional 2-C-methyl-D-erythritol 4-phosphate cytidylyltransferase/2-C-methyl-D-erythritol 2,4-cyclodiphosphate synthase [Helicobacter burdigaliensis]|uniref:bifunctional 2-C-methyl-D-erythritol 4-phosphate cytidylyltransferase/2-C-methyl-D-erythritol 2,4-cyclodiphosphate synthase n=1 Tax=Helicobacter burdigaliensis TaxID=2315334 RepID=UPI000EF73160|nr:bifunctional 2-C-methyl-D-erythritol 4-phosphate cytidylyltransferase/2-C-methyl-D-erythritol 2,4-cyclodiphosphate synthase [Helicobacter burdigaliensis]